LIEGKLFKKESNHVTRYPQEALTVRFEQWFGEEMPRLYRYLCYQTRDPFAAEEITSTTCEKALKKIDQYDPLRGELRVWLFGIAKNEMRSYYRSLKQHPTQISIDHLPDFTFQTQSPEYEYQRKEAFARILRLLAEFPEREQEIIALRYGAALPVQQIASITGLEENHIGVLLHRIVDKLKKSLEEVSYDYERK
jgi:RNA polymerase sigma-70 factor, ECF subfamily